MFLKRFSEEHPLLFALAAIVLVGVFTGIPLQGMLAPLLGPGYADYATGMIEQFLATIGVIVLGGTVGLKGKMGFNAPKPWRTAALGWPLLLFAMINVPNIVLRGTIALNFASILPFVLFFLYLSTGFIEEGLFRGLVSGLLMRRWGKTKRGVCAAALISSLLFGLAHIFNLFQRQYTPLASLTQILFGIFFGLFFHSLFLRTKSLAPGIFLHALVDFAGHLDQLIPGSLPPSEQIVSKTPMEALISIGITLPLFLYGLFLLRKVEPRGD